MRTLVQDPGINMSSVQMRLPVLRQTLARWLPTRRALNLSSAACRPRLRPSIDLVGDVITIRNPCSIRCSTPANGVATVAHGTQVFTNRQNLLHTSLNVRMRGLPLEPHRDGQITRTSQMAPMPFTWRKISGKLLMPRTFSTMPMSNSSPSGSSGQTSAAS